MFILYRRNNRCTGNKGIRRRQAVHTELGSTISNRCFKVSSQVFIGNGRQWFRGGGTKRVAQLRRRRRTILVGSVRQRRGISVQECQYGSRRKSKTWWIQSAEIYEWRVSQSIQGALSNNGEWSWNIFQAYYNICSLFLKLIFLQNKTVNTQGKRILQEIPFNPPIHAFYDNNALNASIRYSLTSPDFDDDVFHIDHLSGRVFLDKEIDADLLPSNIFLLKVNL